MWDLFVAGQLSLAGGDPEVPLVARFLEIRIAVTGAASICPSLNLRRETLKVEIAGEKT